MSKMYKRTCNFCGKYYEKTNSKKFCCQECSHKGYTRTVKRISIIRHCLLCDKKFEYRMWNSVGKFCGRECYTKYVAIPPKQCVICGIEYIPERGAAPYWNKSKYCSLTCMREGAKKGKNKTCPYCKATFWVKPKDNKLQNFCSTRCYHNSQKGKSQLKQYKKGYRAEYEAKKMLENQGYFVIRNFLSWGVWDLCALGEDHIRLIQVKSSKFVKISYSYAFKELVGYSSPDFATKELWCRTDYKGWKMFAIEEKEISRIQIDEIRCSRLQNKEIISMGSLNEGQRKVNDLVILLDCNNKKLTFFQMLPESYEGRKEKILEKYAFFKDKYFNIQFRVMSEDDDINSIFEESIKEK